MQGTCDHCGKVFNVKMKTKHHPKKVIETYFKCPHCKHNYTCFATNPDIRKMQEDIKPIKNNIFRSAMQREINEKMKILKGEIMK
ncbi:hypothetical protein D1B31_16210 [Neobacillus notoginsengisoli]|uniref:C2H2-type domain-containing protein n=1 Tax=Neobacillus notoginsengisoli TaxID=1578198 RepID=A0A417YRH9_9BACI|nr:hypothetical protein [Neobacillus notoginsengisoli]RHW37309.1 hypothetical protein D1B31_16210 [Neobacillus notoginsengisoli]